MAIGRLVAGAALVAAAGMAGPAAAADGAAQTARAPDRSLLAPTEPPKNPYRRLFLLPGQKDASTTPRLAARPGPIVDARPTVVCGTTLVPIDPTVDPGIRVSPRRADTHYTMRAVEPPICRSR